MNNTGTNEPKKSTKMFVNGVLILTISNILVKTIGLLFKIPLHDYLGDEGMGQNLSATRRRKNIRFSFMEKESEICGSSFAIVNTDFIPYL